MLRLRILIAGVNPLLSEILIDGLSRDHRFEAVRFTGSCDSESLATAAHLQEPAVLVLGDQVTVSPSERVHLLCARPELVIMTIDGGGRSARFDRLRVETGSLANISMPDLITSILDLCEDPVA